MMTERESHLARQCSCDRPTCAETPPSVAAIADSRRAPSIQTWSFGRVAQSNSSAQNLANGGLAAPDTATNTTLPACVYKLYKSVKACPKQKRRGSERKRERKEGSGERNALRENARENVHPETNRRGGGQNNSDDRSQSSHSRN